MNNMMPGMMPQMPPQGAQQQRDPRQMMPAGDGAMSEQDMEMLRAALAGGQMGGARPMPPGMKVPTLADILQGRGGR